MKNNIHILSPFENVAEQSVHEDDFTVGVDRRVRRIAFDLRIEKTGIQRNHEIHGRGYFGGAKEYFPRLRRLGFPECSFAR